MLRQFSLAACGLCTSLLSAAVPPTPIIGANDAPVLDNTRSPALSPVGADAPGPAGAVGTLVSSLVDYAVPDGQVDNVTDLDVTEGDAAPGTGIAVVAADAVNGTWFYSINGGGTWSALGPVSGASSRLLSADASTRIYFRPNAGFSGTLATALIVRAWDRTTGINGSLVSTATNGGPTAYSSDTDGVSVTVLAPAPITYIGATTDPALMGDMSLTLGVPAGSLSGHLLATAISVRPNTTAITAPSGWTLLRRVDNAASSANSLAVYYRVADGSEPVSYTWTLGGSHGGAAGAMLTLANVNTADPIDADGGQTTPAGLSHTAPSLTSTVSGAALITVHGFASAANWTPPAGMFEVVDVASQSIGTNGVSMEMNVLGLVSPGATGTRTATASANADAGAAISVAVVPAAGSINSAPVLDAGMSPALAATAEDAGAPAGAVGTLVSALVDFASPSGQVDNITDADAGAVTGIAITAKEAGNGTCWYSTDGGAFWSVMPAVGHTNALLLRADASTRVYFQPNANVNGVLAAVLTFRAWDQTSGSNGSTASVAGNGGSTAFSLATDVASIAVTAVNDAPQATNLSAAEAYTEDVPLDLQDIVVSDVDHATTTVTVTLSNPAAGSLNTATSGPVTSTYTAGTGVWSASGALANVNTLLAGLVYTPAPNFNSGFLLATSVSDGVAAPVTGAKNMSGTPANDPPVLNTAVDPALSTVIEDAPPPSGPVGTLVSALVNLNPPAGGLDNVTDADAGALTGLAIVMVNVDLGTAYYSLNNGTNWSPVGPVNMSSARSLAADATTRVYFAPVANLSGGLSPFAIVAWDQTTGTNGGLSNANGGGSGTSAFSAASDELYMIVTPVNDAPQATNLNAGETYTANTPLNLIDIVVSDVDHANTNVSLSLSNTAAGSLNTATSGAVTSTYNSGTGVWAASGAIADVNVLLAGLTFTPANNFGSDFTIAVQVSDGVAAPLSGSKLMTGPGAPVIAIIPRVVLEGSYNPTTGLMNGAMRAAGLVPVTEPYTALGYTYTGTVGGSTTPAVLAVGGADAVHDWVIVELRSAADPAVVVYSRAALLQRDGQVADFDGVSPVTFGVAPGNYYLAVRHRNHLGAMTAAAIGYTATPSFLDMAAIGFPCYGTEAQKTISGSFPTQALWAGDVSFNGAIKYTGSGNDRDPILVAVGSTTPNNTAALYSTCDVNLDGVVKYTGSGNDRDPILVNVGSTTPNNTRVQQLP